MITRRMITHSSKLFSKIFLMKLNRNENNNSKQIVETNIEIKEIIIPLYYIIII